MIWTLKILTYGALIFYAFYREKNCYNLFKEYEICRYTNETIVRNTKTEPEYSMIWLHGLGASPKAFETFFIENNLLPKNFRLVLPKAPTSYVTQAKQYMNSWFDIYNWDFHSDNINFQDVLRNDSII